MGIVVFDDFLATDTVRVPSRLSPKFHFQNALIVVVPVAVAVGVANDDRFFGLMEQRKGSMGRGNQGTTYVRKWCSRVLGGRSSSTSLDPVVGVVFDDQQTPLLTACHPSR